MSGFVTGMKVGRFRIESEIGRGGMGVVYRALDLVLQRPVALKGIAPNMGSDRDALSRFHREAAAAANLRHPNIAAVYEFGLHQDQPYIIFEWIEGRSLKDLLRIEKRLPLERTRRLVDSLADALDYAHRNGVVHRDIKPGNILIDARDRPIIVDFGLAWLSHAPALSRAGEFFGTPAYIAPEQCLGDDLDGRADLYSLAVVVYEMLAGRPPFTAKTMAALFHKHIYVLPPRITTFDPSLPAWVDSALMRALAKDPQARFPSGAAFSQALHGSLVAESKPTLPVAVNDTLPYGIDVEAATLPAGGIATAILAAPAQEPASATQPRGRSRAWLLALPLILLCLGLVGGAGWIGSALAGRGQAAPAASQAAATALAGLGPTETVAAPASPIATTASPAVVMTVTVLVTASAAAETPGSVGAAGTAESPTNAAASATAQSTSTAAPSSTAVPASASAAASATATGAAATLSPTASASPVPPTGTPTSPPTMTPSPTPPPSAAPSATPVPSATPLPSQTASPAPSPAPTSTLIATPGCNLAGGTLVFSSDTELVWNLQNNEAAAVSLASLVVDWPDNPIAQTLQTVVFGGHVIASPGDELPPTVLPAEAAWTGEQEHLELEADSAKDLQLQFSDKLKNKGYTVTVIFDNGCALSASS